MLQAAGIEAGPITETTRPTYIRMLRKRQATKGSGAEKAGVRGPVCSIEPKRLKLSSPVSHTNKSSAISYSGNPRSESRSNGELSHTESSTDSNFASPRPSFSEERHAPVSPFVPSASKSTPPKPRSVCLPMPQKRALDSNARAPQGSPKEPGVSWRLGTSSREPAGNWDRSSSPSLSPGRHRNEGLSPGRRFDDGTSPRRPAGVTPKRPGSEGLSPRRPRDEVTYPKRPVDKSDISRGSATQRPMPSQPDEVPGDDDPEESPSDSEEENGGGGIVNVLTRWFGKGVKRIVGHIREQGLSRQPLGSAGDSPLPPPNSENGACPPLSSPSGGLGSSSSLGPSSPLGAQQSPRSEPPPSPSAGVDTYDWEIHPTDVEICTRPDGSFWALGKGGFGEVFKGLKDGVDEVAVKVIRLSHPDVVSQFKEEIELISKLRHRHIVQFYGACVQPSSLYMVTELMETDLFSALRRDQRYLWSGTHGRSVTSGIASGLHYLHSRKPPVVHRDIKSPNVLLMGGVAKIADVGVARTKANMDMTAQKGFTAAWAAPEVVFRKRATEKIDIWSFGVVMWEVVTGNMPKAGQLVLPPWCPGPLRNLYCSCMMVDPTARPNAGKIVQDLKLIP